MRLIHDGERDRDSLVKQRLARLRGGCVLMALEQLTDPNFDCTMVLTCVYGTEGAYGLVLNRPSHMPISEMFDGFTGSDSKRKMYIGGPVQQETLQILHVTNNPVPHAFQIVPGIYMGGQWDDMVTVLRGTESSIRLFLGYSGWKTGQLEAEIECGAWEVYNVDLTALLTGPEDLWRGDQSSLKGLLGQLSIP